MRISLPVNSELRTSSSSELVEDGEEVAEVIRQLIASWQKAQCSEEGGMWPKLQHNEVKLVIVVWVLHPVRIPYNKMYWDLLNGVAFSRVPLCPIVYWHLAILVYYILIHQLIRKYSY